jgi:hypothetical protein
MHSGTTRNYNPYVFAEAITGPDYVMTERKRDNPIVEKPSTERKPPRYLKQLADAFKASGNKLSETEIRIATGKHMGIDAISRAVDPWLLIYEDDGYDRSHPEKYHVLNVEVLK